jgi:hypothetical protein
MRVSRKFRLFGDAGEGEDIPTRRILVWVLVWIAILAGIVLYFKYARLLTPMLG